MSIQKRKKKKVTVESLKSVNWYRGWLLKLYVYCIWISNKNKYLGETDQAHVPDVKTQFLTHANLGPADLAVVPITTFTYISHPILLNEAEWVDWAESTTGPKES